MRTLFILLLLLCNGFTLLAKDSTKVTKKFTDVFPGKSVLTLYSNVRIGVGKESATTKFQVQRAYIGYKFNNESAWSGAIIFDLFDAKDINKELEFSAYLKNAYISFKRNRIKLNLGVIKTLNFDIQQSSWGHRYLMKSYIDEYGLAPSADLGVSAEYKFNDWLNADLSFTNGKGYKDYEIDGNFRYGFGFMLKPIKNLSIRTFYDLYTKDNSVKDGASQHTLSAAVAYKHKIFTAGAEYNYMLNTDYKKDVNLGGFSIYSTVKIIDKLYTFARFDRLNSNNNDTVEDTGCAIRSGIDYRPFNFLRISPNFYNWNPSDSPSQSYIYLNLSVNF